MPFASNRSTDRLLGVADDCELLGVEPREESRVACRFVDAAGDLFEARELRQLFDSGSLLCGVRVKADSIELQAADSRKKLEIRYKVVELAPIRSLGCRVELGGGPLRAIHVP